jgi:hypothetical protein
MNLRKNKKNFCQFIKLTVQIMRLRWPNKKYFIKNYKIQSIINLMLKYIIEIKKKIIQYYVRRENSKISFAFSFLFLINYKTKQNLVLLEHTLL